MKITLILLLGIIMGILISIFSEPVADYHVNYIGKGKVKLMDNKYNKLKTTTIDSIGYYIIEDNI